MSAAAYFTTTDGLWFRPTGYTRGPWDVDACHAGPPAALIARAMERIVPDKRLARISVELIRPIPMRGFRVQAEVRRPGRSVTFSGAEIFDEERVFARAYGMHLRVLNDLDCSTAVYEVPDFATARPGPFPISESRMAHSEQAFPSSIEVRYDAAASQGTGGSTIVWMRTIVPILPDEEPSGFQRICPLADSGNGLSYNDYLDKILFVNTDLTVSLIREPAGEWFGSRVVSHWQRDGTGLADAELFDPTGPLGRATQSLLLMPAGG
jgi:hypothetical protein